MPTDASTTAARPLILVIEDYVDLREMLVAALEHGGYRTLALNSGDEVLITPRSILLEASGALVDDAFPGNLSGPQTVVLLHYINPRLKIFPISGRPFLGWEVELMETHYQRCLAKPFGVEELLDTLADDAAENSL